MTRDAAFHEAAERTDLPTTAARGRRGFSMIEVMVVVTMMAVILAMTAPTFQRSVEMAKTDIAIANLRALWAAERFYWVEYRAYTDDLSLLTSLGLLDPETVAAVSPFQYTVSVSADGSAFSATATRAPGGHYAGSFTIDQTGSLTGSLTAQGEPDINPPTL